MCGRRLADDPDRGAPVELVAQPVVLAAQEALARTTGQLDELRKKKEKPGPELQKKMDAVRADYEHQLDARYAAARGFVDAVLPPERLRERFQNGGPEALSDYELLEMALFRPDKRRS